MASRWPSLCQPRLGSLPRLRSVRSDRFTFRDAQLPAVGVPSSPTSGSSISPSCHRNHSRAHSALIRFSSSVISPSANGLVPRPDLGVGALGLPPPLRLPSTRPGAEHHRVTSALPLREHRAALGTHGHLARLPDPAPAPHGSFGTGAGGVAPASVETESRRSPRAIGGRTETGDYPSAHAQSRIAAPLGRRRLGDTPHPLWYARSSDRRG